MSASIENAAITAHEPAKAALKRKNYLIGPTSDFLLLGGASLFVLPVIAIAWPQGADNAQLAAVMFFVANLINHPHFAHSYQLFYRDFKGRAFGDSFPAGLRRRYVFAALVAPIFLVAFFACSVAASNAMLLGSAASLMFFLVGWHYVKQGYGMLMVDAVLKRSFFDERAKKILLWNAYAVWILSWMLLNRAVADADYWGVGYLTFAFPDWLFYTLMGCVAATSVAAASVLLAKVRQGVAPWNGVVAYVVSLYVWLLTAHPALLLVIPAFHSLQYLAVVWRYRFNMERAGDSVARRRWPTQGPWLGLGIFVLMGCLLGYVAFWRAPFLLGKLIPYDQHVFGPTLFLFLFWIFINVHHYFLDNVMWRKDNPDTRRYLFGAG